MKKVGGHTPYLKKMKKRMQPIYIKYINTLTLGKKKSEVNNTGTQAVAMGLQARAIEAQVSNTEALSQEQEQQQEQQPAESQDQDKLSEAGFPERTKRKNKESMKKK